VAPDRGGGVLGGLELRQRRRPIAALARDPAEADQRPRLTRIRFEDGLVRRFRIVEPPRFPEDGCQLQASRAVRRIEGERALEAAERLRTATGPALRETALGQRRRVGRRQRLGCG
jgi:hypothetical protein